MIKLKNEEEIKGIKESGRILYDTLEELKKMVIPGVYTEELDTFTRDYLKKRNALPAFLGYHGFPGALCTSVNNEIIHGIPKKRKLKEGDIIGIDLGVVYRGFVSDSAVTLSVGKISQEASTLMKVTKECLEKAIEAAQFGNRIKDISRAVYTHASNHNYGIVREYCGHGVGFEVHEEPQVSNYPGNGPNPRLKPGMVFAIEPMINLGGSEIDHMDDGWTVITADGSISAHFEHTIAILKDRTEILTIPEP